MLSFDIWHIMLFEVLGRDLDLESENLGLRDIICYTKLSLKLSEPCAFIPKLRIKGLP